MGELDSKAVETKCLLCSKQFFVATNDTCKISNRFFFFLYQVPFRSPAF